MIAVDGGNGNAGGGGGGGGRMAIYWQDLEWWYGKLTAFGGRSSQGGNGGPGTLYLEVSVLWIPISLLLKLLVLKTENFETCIETNHKIKSH